MNTDQRVFTRFMLSYLFVFLIPIVIGYIMYERTISTLSEDARQNNVAMLEQSRDIVDARLSEILLQGQQLAINAKNLSLHKAAVSGKKTPVYPVWDFLYDLSQFQITNPFASDFYVFYKGNQLIVTSDTSYINAEFFYKEHIAYTGVTYDQWQKRLWNDMENGQYVPLGTVGNKNNARELLAYVQSFPLGAAKQHQSKILLLIELKQVQGLLNKVSIGDDGFVVILDREGTPVTVLSGNSRTLPTEDFEQLLTGGKRVQTSEGSELIVSRAVSRYNGWNYISAVPASSVYAKVNYIREIISVFIILVLLVGLFVIYILARKTSRPLREMKRELEEQRPYLQTAFIRRLLYGEFRNESELAQEQLRLHMNVDCSDFAAALISFYPEEPNENTGNDVSLESPDVARVLVKKEWSKAGGDDRVWFYDMGDNKIGLITFYDREETDLQMRIQETTDAVLQQLSPYGIYIQVAVGSLRRKVIDAGSSFDEARQAADYFRYKPEQSVLCYHEIPKEDQMFYYPIDLEIRLISAMKSGDADTATALLHTVYDENQKRRSLSASMLEQLLFSLKVTVLRGLNSLLPEEQSVDLLEPIRNAVSIQSLVADTKTAMRSGFNRLDELRQNDRHELIERVLESLHRQYNKEGMNLDHLAAEFKVVSSSLYTLFREQVGTTFADYLEKYRIREACKRIESSQGGVAIKDIAYAVGYNNDHTFRRAFKRVMGMLPSDYALITRN
ncbi:hypothetical protein SY83_09220 [Paenibacillus swuensis]|uniref:HTH araC/xylS-type domain-containing protein n=1 Tax=Paenibacillus swuensis TaxID=1178515 RepID=A0A172THQ7_9BACL|nr:helix-turn-helix domain-containing protein [Paenibacillus swuensis]ANE46424.1 hypothetical protein SY83_09220 [Paenibacillus swuensis]